jgi:hypothetical protein
MLGICGLSFNLCGSSLRRTLVHIILSATCQIDCKIGSAKLPNESTKQLSVATMMLWKDQPANKTPKTKSNVFDYLKQSM